MKTFESSKMLLASSIALALSGCGTESYTPPVKLNESAPTHGGDINITLEESVEEDRATRAVDLLGTPQGVSSGVGVATDADANYLSVTDVDIQFTGPAPEEVVYQGVYWTGNQMTIRPQVFAPELDIDETQTIVATYNVFDGKHKTARTVTISLNGVDFAPEIANDLVGNYTRDAGMTVIDGLKDVTDADGEELKISDVVANSDNSFDLPVTIDGTNFNVDISAVKANIPDGETVTFNFTYIVSDHRFDIARNMSINVLGVNDVPGAPLFSQYFLTETVDETATVQVYDLAVDAVDREGDDIVINTLMLNGSDTLPYGISVEGNNVTFDPHAFFADVEMGETKDYVFTYKVADTSGNTSDGERNLTVTLNGVETNMIAATGFNANFEKPDNVGAVDATNTNGFFFGWANGVCSVKEIRAESARTGMYGFRQEGSRCDTRITSSNFIEVLPADSKLLTSYWFRPEVTGPNLNPWTILAPALYFDESRSGGRLYDDGVTNVWKEYARVIDTNEGGLYNDIVGGPLMHTLSQYGGTTAQVGKVDIDDITLIDYGTYDVVAHDILTDDTGTFDGSAPESTGGGTVAIVDGQLSIMTAAATVPAEGVTVKFPLQAGAIKAGNRYLVDLDVVYSNFATVYPDGGASTKTPFTVTITNGVESFSANVPDKGFVTTYTPDAVLSTGTNSAIVDWASEDLTLNITFTDVNAEYLVDNVRLIAIPN